MAWPTPEQKTDYRLPAWTQQPAEGEASSGPLGSLNEAGTLGKANSTGSGLTSLAGGNAALGLPGGAGLGSIGAGAYTGYLQGKGALNALKGEDMNFAEETALALPTFGLSYAVDPVKKLLGVGHGQNYVDHQKRKSALGQFFNGNPQEVALGSQTYDLSAERDKTQFNHQMDNSTPQSAEGITYFKPLAMMLANGDPKMSEDLTRIFYNQTTDGGNVDEAGLRQAALRVYNHFGAKPSEVVDFLKSKSGLPEDQIGGLLNGVNALRPGGQALKFRSQTTAVAPGAASPQGGIQNAPQPVQGQPGQSAADIARQMGMPGATPQPATALRPMGTGAVDKITPMVYNSFTKTYEPANT